jgi:hypothetical protein
MAEGKGLLFVTMQPPEGLEEEFNDWYDTEHVPERAGLPGFETARRFVCIEGWPRYLALYDLAAVGALHTPEYLAVGGDRSSPWTKRVTGRVRGLCRMEATQVFPGQAITGAQGAAARLCVLRFHGAPASAETALVKGLREAFGGRDLAQLRVFRSSEGGADAYLAIAELRCATAPAPNLAALGEAARFLDLSNVYIPYFARGRAA